MPTIGYEMSGYKLSHQKVTDYNLGLGYFGYNYYKTTKKVGQTIVRSRWGCPLFDQMGPSVA